ncbi:hypothetical protein AKJ40_02945 [candidate division MSBL1 archaeon SCGC-AAA259M10]|uniref:Ribose-5-phosphate isomerase A n=1 Tax=candidate division MSBL1 archaeon SCGC-AAA259M10 TaxID=1698270 RepID=A0A133UZ96_9EURY|nr:hypothetical protein AKJ40_02945 [candidate division MSBL1 archaeon SCGC-AAA259M10]
MPGQEEWKRNSAREAAKLVRNDMLVGLGSGTTVAKVVKELVEKGTKARFVTASIATQKLADRLDLNLTTLEKGTGLDLTIDGADEIDPNLRLLKGGGGAHTRERIVTGAAEELVIVADSTKLVEKLGEKNPVPVEVIPFAYEYVAGLIEEYGKRSELRRTETGNPYVTDNGNYIVDLRTDPVNNPEKLREDLDKTPGTVDNGIFTDKPDKALIGHEEGCRAVETKEQHRELRRALK